MNFSDIYERQKAICERFGADFFGCDMNLKVGIARNFKDGLRPLNGLRIRPSSDTCGWYIWAGTEWSEDADFFVPLHASHLEQWAPLIIPYIGLPPGWRFLVTEDYEDVWQDSKILQD
jgi:hypothetical protein